MTVKWRGWAVVIVAAVWASVLCSAGRVRGDEKSREIPPETLTKMNDTFKKAGVQKRKQFDAFMHDEIAFAAKDTGLNADGIKSLEDAATKAEDAAVDDFEAGCLQAVRAVYAKGGVVTLNWANSKTVATVIGPGGPTGDGVSFAGPSDQPAWKDGLARVLTPEQLATWEKARIERKKATDRAIADFLEKQVERYRAQQEKTVLAQSSEINASLDLPKERAEQITALAKKATDASMELWRQAVEKSLSSKDEAGRNQTLKNKNFYFQFNNKDAPEKQAVWTDGLAKLLTDDDRTRLQAVRDGKKARRLHAVAQLIVTLLDEKIAFTESQRQRLEPIMERLAQAETAFFPGSDNGNYYSLQLGSAYKTASKAKPEEIQPILDVIQWKHWQTLGHGGNAEDDNDNEFMQSAAPSPASQEVSAGEPEDMERIVSDYLQTRAAAQYRQVEAVMVLHAEDATRVAALEPPHALRLQTAAQGAAAAVLAAWEPNVEQNVRAEVQGATPENIRQKLANGTRYAYPRMDPNNNALWTATVTTELTPAQQTAWTAERDARNRYNDTAVAGFLLAEFDRKFSLLPEQWDKLALSLTKAIQDYQSDIRGMFAYGNTPWFLASYSMFLPLHAVPENELKAVLSPAQWDRWTGSQECNYTSQYWDNIRQMHNQRVHQKDP